MSDNEDNNGTNEEAKEENKQETKDLDTIHARFNVDIWASELHKEEIGFFKDARRAFKDRQWSKDSEILGMVQRDDEEFGPLAFREGEWQVDNFIDSKLVIKSFTPSNYWRASIEFLPGKSIMLSHVSNEPTPAFIVNYDRSDFVTRIHKVPHKRSFRGETWGFDLLLDDGEVRSFCVDDNRFTLSDDFYIKDIHNNVIGEIDGKFLNVGGRYDIKIYDADLASDKRFYMTIILFTSVIEFLDELNDRIKIMVGKLRRGEKLQLDHHSEELYYNPRKLHG